MSLFRKKLLSPICVLLCFACQQQDAKTHVNISAKRLDGSPVALAKVEIDGSIVGETNAFGTFKDSVYLAINTEHQLNVSFNDNTYYYSPHLTKFRVQPGGSNNIDVKAIMYLAPKPKKINVSDSALVNEHTATTPTATASSISSDDERFTLPLAPITTKDFVIQSPNEVALPDRARIMLTAHAFSGHTPLAGATVIWSEPNFYEYQCTTNDRGRCIIHASAGSSSPGTLLIRKSGFESASQKISALENQNVRLKLNPGNSLDLRLFSASLRRDTPYGSVAIYRGNTKIATSDGNGYAVIPLGGKQLVDLKFAPPGRSIMIDAGEFTEFGEVVKIKLVSEKPETLDYKVSDLHVFKNKDVKLKAQIINSITKTLITEASAERAPSIQLSSEKSDPTFIGIIPILESSPKGLTLTLTAFEPLERLVISEQISQIPHTKGALEAAVSTLFERIKRRHSISGFIESIDGNQIQVSIDTGSIEIGDSLNIADDTSELKAIVLSAQKGKALAKLPPTFTAKNSWIFLGKKATRQARDASSISSLVDLLPKLMAKSPESETIDLAKKHRMENNPRQALRDIDMTKVDDHPTRILLLQERANAHLALDEKGPALAALYEALSIASEHAPQSVVSIISININRIRSEALPVLKDDKDLVESLLELDSDNARLMADLATQKTGHLTEATLRYATLLTKQKLAEASLDVANMTTLRQAWDSFLKELHDNVDKEHSADLSRAVNLARRPFLMTTDERSVSW
jgi:hypothetical protein